MDGTDLVVVAVYVDDIIEIRANKEAIDRFFASLGSLFIKDLGSVTRMRVIVDDDGSYVVNREGAIGDLRRDHKLKDTNSTHALVGSDCCEVALAKLGPSLSVQFLILRDGSRVIRSSSESDKIVDSALLIAEVSDGPSI